MKPRTSNLIAIVLLTAMILASSAYWVMRLRKPPAVDVSATSIPATPTATMSATEALFGERPAALSSIRDLRVSGVVIDATPAESIAIVIDGEQPGRAVRVGADIVPGIRLTEVHRRYIVLSDGTGNTRINLPESATQETAAPQTAQDASPTAPAPTPTGTGGLREEPPHRSGNPEEDDSPPLAPAP
jgi:general secretion pathway protein C